MRYLLLFLLAWLIYRYLKPMLQKPQQDPFVKGNQSSDSNGHLKNRNIEDADFEELDK